MVYEVRVNVERGNVRHLQNVETQRRQTTSNTTPRCVARKKKQKEAQRRKMEKNGVLHLSGEASAQRSQQQNEKKRARAKTRINEIVPRAVRGTPRAQDKDPYVVLAYQVVLMLFSWYFRGLSLALIESW